MGLIRNIFGWAAGFLRSPITPIGDLSAFEAWHDGVGSAPASAIQLSAVHACWKVVGESLAALPVRVMRRDSDGRSAVSDHSWNMRLRRPGRDLTRFDLIETLVVSMMAQGRGAAQIVRNGLGEPLQVVPLDVERLRKISDQVYEYALGPGETRRLMRDDLWLPTYFLGLSPLALMRLQIEEATAADRAARSGFENSSRPSGALEFPQRLDDEQKAKVRHSWQAGMAGPANHGRVAILDQGIKWAQFQTLSAKDAEFLGQRRFSKEEIASIYRVPLHLLNDLSNAHFTNIEHQDLAFVKHCLMPWIVRLEQSMDRDLLSESEVDDGYFFHFVPDAIQRGDYKSRMDGLNQAVGGPIMSLNEARKLEDLPPVPGGDDVLRPMNMGGVEDADEAGD